MHQGIMSSSSLATRLNKLTKPGVLYKKIDDMDDRIECFSCAHRCRIKDGKSGICNVRYNDRGTLMVPFNYTAGFQVDPIEKKPFFHAYPGSNALSIGMWGCDLHCSYCQNWVSSQALRDETASSLVNQYKIRKISAEDIISTGVKLESRVVVSTYNEPLITSEWAVEIFKEAKRYNLATGYVSNGNATPEVLDYLNPWLDLYKIDLKSFQDKNYRHLGGRLEKILEGIKEVYKRGMWMELVTLLVPGFNDTPEELQQMAEFVVSVDPSIPWHVTAFHTDYKMNDKRNTTPADLLKAVEIGKEAGLQYVYAGNLPSRVKNMENTYCHNCDTVLIERAGFRVRSYEIDENKCPNCRTTIPGVWEKPPSKSQLFHFLR